MNEDESGMSLVMPFVVVESVGGPFEDRAYCAGFEAGKMQAALEQGPRGLSAVVRVENEAQLDLIAMEQGYVIDKREPWEDGDVWVCLHFVPSEKP